MKLDKWMVTWNRTWRWNMAGPVPFRLYSTLNDIGDITLCDSSAIWKKGILLMLMCYVRLKFTFDDLNVAGEVESLISKLLITDRNAWIKWALTVASGFPLTSTVNVSSFSVVIKFPNHDRLVSSGDESGVKYTSSDETANESQKSHWIFRFENLSEINFYLVIFFDEIEDCPRSCFWCWLIWFSTVDYLRCYKLRQSLQAMVHYQR